MSQDILRNLKCSECNEYLSWTPIMLKKNGKSICGRCPVPEKDRLSSTRNVAYEELARAVLFPCTYNKDGCHTQLQFNHVKIHEETCKYRKQMCPTSANSNACAWAGQFVELIGHYRSCHPDYLMKYPVKYKVNIGQASEQNLLAVVYGLMFLVQVKYSIVSGKIWYCVRLLGDPIFCKNFRFVLEVSSPFGQIVKKLEVQAQDKCVINKNTSIETDINSLVKMLGSYEDIKFTLRYSSKLLPSSSQPLMQCSCSRLEIRDNSCNTCGVQLAKTIFSEDRGICCAQCMLRGNQSIPAHKILRFCQYNPKGCFYGTNNEPDLRKHHIWLCEYSDCKCIICELPCRNMSPMKHFSLMHVNENYKFRFIDNLACVTYKDLELNKWYDLIFVVDDIVFRLNIMINYVQTNVNIVTNLMPEQTKNFACSFKFIVNGLCFEKPFSNISADVYNKFGLDWCSTSYSPQVLFQNNIYKINCFSLLIARRFCAS